MTKKEHANRSRNEYICCLHAGTVMLNPNPHDCPSIMIKYKEYFDTPTVFPKLESVLEVASKEMDSVSLSAYCMHVILLLITDVTEPFALPA